MVAAVYYVAYLRDGSVFVHLANPQTSYEVAWRLAGLTQKCHPGCYYFVTSDPDITPQQAVEWRAMTHDGY